MPDGTRPDESGLVSYNIFKQYIILIENQFYITLIYNNY